MQFAVDIHSWNQLSVDFRGAQNLQTLQMGTDGELMGKHRCFVVVQ